MSTAGLLSRNLIVSGNIAMLIGAIDPLEGSIVILLGSGLVLLGNCFAQGEKRFFAYRIWVFILILIGVVSLWVLSTLGGFGGTSGLPIWWGLLILPYPIGWFLGIWGPDSPRWALWSGLGVGLWYLTIPALLINLKDTSQSENIDSVAVIMGAIGVLTIAGCAYRLTRQKNIAGN